MSGTPWDPSPRGGAPPGISAIRGGLLDRIERSTHTGFPAGWGFVLTGASVIHGAHETGWLYVVTPGDAVPLTQGMVSAAAGRPLFLLGCARAVLSVPAMCDARWYHDSEPIPAIEVEADVRSTWPRAGGGRLEATVHYWQAARSPLAILTDGPIPGWPL
jgi:hypothetical protein